MGTARRLSCLTRGLRFRNVGIHVLRDSCNGTRHGGTVSRFHGNGIAFLLAASISTHKVSVRSLPCIVRCSLPLSGRACLRHSKHANQVNGGKVILSLIGSHGDHSVGHFTPRPRRIGRFFVCNNRLISRLPDHRSHSTVHSTRGPTITGTTGVRGGTTLITSGRRRTGGRTITGGAGGGGVHSGSRGGGNTHHGPARGGLSRWLVGFPRSTKEANQVHLYKNFPQQHTSVFIFL